MGINQREPLASSQARFGLCEKGQPMGSETVKCRKYQRIHVCVTERLKPVGILARVAVLLHGCE